MILKFRLIHFKFFFLILNIYFISFNLFHFINSFISLFFQEDRLQTLKKNSRLLHYCNASLLFDIDEDTKEDESEVSLSLKVKTSI